jgi:hypothetical protein
MDLISEQIKFEQFCELLAVESDIEGFDPRLENYIDAAEERLHRFEEWLSQQSVL